MELSPQPVADVPAILTDENKLFGLVWYHGRAKQIRVDQIELVSVVVVGKRRW